MLEMGANHPGEIGYMTDIARPEVALITNAGRAHLEGFGSLEGVARAKGEIARGLPRRRDLRGPRRFALHRPVARPGRRAARADLRAWTDACGRARRARLGRRSTGATTGFRTRFTALLAAQPQPLALRLAGLHNVRNALAAAAAALAPSGSDSTRSRAGLASLPPVPGRL